MAQPNTVNSFSNGIQVGLMKGAVVEVNTRVKNGGWGNVIIMIIYVDHIYMEKLTISSIIRRFIHAFAIQVIAIVAPVVIVRRVCHGGSMTACAILVLKILSWLKNHGGYHALISVVVFIAENAALRKDERFFYEIGEMCLSTVLVLVLIFQQEPLAEAL